MKFNEIFKMFFMAAVLMAGLSACSVDEPAAGGPVQGDKVAPLTSDAVAGELLVRFDKFGAVTKKNKLYGRIILNNKRAQRNSLYAFWNINISAAVEIKVRRARYFLPSFLKHDCFKQWSTDKSRAACILHFNTARNKYSLKRVAICKCRASYFDK